MSAWDESYYAFTTIREYDYDTPRDENYFTHELVAGAASFAAFKAFEDRQRGEGIAVDHSFAKEALADFAGAEVDRLLDNYGGLNFLDYERAKWNAVRLTERMYDEHYGGYEMYDPAAYGWHNRFDDW